MVFITAAWVISVIQNDKAEKALTTQELKAERKGELEIKEQKEQALKAQKKREQEILYSKTQDDMTRLEIIFAENTGFWNDNEEKLTEIKGKACKMIENIPRNTRLYTRIQKFIDKCNEQL